MSETHLELVHTNAQLAFYIDLLEKPKYVSVVKVRRTLVSTTVLPGMFDFSGLKSRIELAALFRRVEIGDYIDVVISLSNHRTFYDICVKESADVWRWAQPLRHRQENYPWLPTHSNDWPSLYKCGVSRV